MFMLFSELAMLFAICVKGASPETAVERLLRFAATLDENLALFRTLKKAWRLRAAAGEGPLKPLRALLRASMRPTKLALGPVVSLLRTREKSDSREIWAELGVLNPLRAELRR